MQQANAARNNTGGQAQSQSEVKADQQGAQDKNDRWALKCKKG